MEHNSNTEKNGMRRFLKIIWKEPLLRPMLVVCGLGITVFTLQLVGLAPDPLCAIFDPNCRLPR